MKQVVLSVLLTVYLSSLGFAQTDLKVSPFQFLWSDVHLGVEYGLSPEIGLEGRWLYDRSDLEYLDLPFKTRKWGIALEGKYYIAPSTRVDGVYLGVYGRGATGLTYNDERRIDRNRVSLGFALGYKWVSRDRLILEVGLGAGRALYDSVLDGTLDLSGFPVIRLDAYTKVNVGYRF